MRWMNANNIEIFKKMVAELVEMNKTCNGKMRYKNIFVKLSAICSDLVKAIFADVKDISQIKYQEIEQLIETLKKEVVDVEKIMSRDGNPVFTKANLAIGIFIGNIEARIDLLKDFQANALKMQDPQLLEGERKEKETMNKGLIAKFSSDVLAESNLMQEKEQLLADITKIKNLNIDGVLMKANSMFHMAKANHRKLFQLGAVFFILGAFLLISEIIDRAFGDKIAKKLDEKDSHLDYKAVFGGGFMLMAMTVALYLWKKHWPTQSATIVNLEGISINDDDKSERQRLIP